MSFDFLNIIILFGAVQGFTLCVYLFAKKQENKTAFRSFLLFLFSLSFFNLIYALLYFSATTAISLPFEAGSFPFPYDYLIGVGFYFYVIHQVQAPHLKKTHSNKIKLLFFPAIIYGVLRLYWFILLESGTDPSIFFKVYQSGFFTYNEFAYLSFNLTLAFFALRHLNEYRSQLEGSLRNQKKWKWLQRFVFIFIGFSGFHFIHQGITLVAGLEDHALMYYSKLGMNSAYIYWIGFIGFANAKNLFTNLKFKKEGREQSGLIHPLKRPFEKLIYDEEIFTNSQLKLADLAQELRISPNALSVFINEVYDCSFSDFMNQRKVDKVKVLLLAPEAQKYTLVAIAEQAGFSSKSSFNAVFKKNTGMTPRQYKVAKALK